MMESTGWRSRGRRAVTVGLGLGLAILWLSLLTGNPIDRDAAETLRMAINLQHHGIASSDAQAPYRPSMTREPVPVLVTSGLIAVSDLIQGRPSSDEAYFAGARARVLKSQNVFWFGLLCVSLYAAVRFLTGSAWFALGGVLVANLALLNISDRKYLLDGLYTEAPAGALLLLGSLLIAIGFFRKNLTAAIVGGMAFGVLALTKAVFLYVFAGFVPILAIAVALNLNPDTRVRGCFRVLMVCLSFAAVVTPWMYRNYETLGTFSIAARGGNVLYLRAIKDRMSPVEVRGAVYYWAPWPLDGLLRRALGFERDAIKRGGPLQRLNRSQNSEFADEDLVAALAGQPQNAICYYHRGAAELVRLTREFERAGYPQPAIEAERRLQRKALQTIVEQPLRHLGMSALFLWRGAFFIFPLLLVSLVFALRRRQFLLALFLTPAMGMILSYALLSHFIPRYSLPTYPVAIVAVIASIMLWRRQYFGALSPRSVTDRQMPPADKPPSPRAATP